MINAQRHTFFGAGHGIGCPRQANFEQHTAASAQKAIRLRDARVICDWSDNTQPSRAPQSHARVVG